MKTKINVLKEIYEKEKTHSRAICRSLNLGMPSVKNALESLKSLLIVKEEGRNKNYSINYKNKDIIPYLYLIENKKIEKLPKKVSYAIEDFLISLKEKPIISLIFGSYANSSYSKESDIDILLVFNKTSKEAEEKAKIVSDLHNIELSPVYLNLKEFKEGFHDQKNRFFKEIKEKKVLLTGIRWWVEVKNEEA